MFGDFKGVRGKDREHKNKNANAEYRMISYMCIRGHRHGNTNFSNLPECGPSSIGILRKP